ncbi:MAG TPA: hypothetical protein VGR28_08775 [Candidatus Thermoplasmatota archaeon]|jgi:hypothetical protein|nr:hypothetical protein [Candidatus Thermoplasmatota archaeon]
MRARTAVALAAMLAAPMALASLPHPNARLEAHAGVQLSAQLQALLARAQSLEAPAAPTLGQGLVVHWLAGARTWTTPLVPGQAQAVDLDGDGRAELRALAIEGAWPRLAVEGLAPAAQPWTAWVEDGAGRWGLAGAGTPPAHADARLLGGTLQVRAAPGASAGWHAAFAITDQAQRSVAWLAEARGPRAFEVQAGEGIVLRTLAEAEGGLRVVVLDGARAVDWTLRGAPAGALLSLDPDGALRYHAARAGGALAHVGDAAPLGQAGALQALLSPLPAQMVLQPAGDGAALAASEPTDVLLDWVPEQGRGDGVRVVGNDVRDLTVQPGATGGVVVRGSEGQAAIERPAGGAPVELGVQVAAAGQPSPWPAALAAGLLAAAVAMAGLQLRKERAAARAG